MADDPVSVRRATADDAAAMARVQAQSWQVAYRGIVADEIIARVVENERTLSERLRAGLGDPNGRRTGGVGVRGEAIVGMAIAGPSRDAAAGDEVAELYAIYLDPDMIGTGIGRDLLQAVVADLRRLRFIEATLWVLTANPRARRFYARAGWRLDGATKRAEAPGGVLDVVRYRLPLDPGQSRG